MLVRLAILVRRAMRVLTMGDLHNGCVQTEVVPPVANQEDPMEGCLRGDPARGV